MLTKEKVFNSLKDLPDTFSFDDLLDRVILIQKIEVGIKQSKAGKIRTTDQAKAKLKKWLK